MTATITCARHVPYMMDNVESDHLLNYCTGSTLELSVCIWKTIRPQMGLLSLDDEIQMTPLYAGHRLCVLQYKYMHVSIFMVWVISLWFAVATVLSESKVLGHSYTKQGSSVRKLNCLVYSYPSL